MDLLQQKLWLSGRWWTAETSVDPWYYIQPQCDSVWREQYLCARWTMREWTHAVPEIGIGMWRASAAGAQISASLYFFLFHFFFLPRPPPAVAFYLFFSSKKRFAYFILSCSFWNHNVPERPMEAAGAGRHGYISDAILFSSQTWIKTCSFFLHEYQHIPDCHGNFLHASEPWSLSWNPLDRWSCSTLQPEGTKLYFFFSHFSDLSHPPAAGVKVRCSCRPAASSQRVASLLRTG